MKIFKVEERALIKLNEVVNFDELCEKTRLQKEALIQHYIIKHPELISHLLSEQIVMSPVGCYIEEIGQDVKIHELHVKFDGDKGGEIDALLIDSEGVLNIVETKSSTNDVNRDTIGQVIQYADAITCDPEGIVNQIKERSQQSWVIGDEELWKKARQNLDNKRIRIFIVAPEIPDEFKYAIEFLSDVTKEQFEIYGVEVKLFKTLKEQFLISELVTSTSADIKKKQQRDTVLWTAEQVQKKLVDIKDEKLRQRLEILLTICRKLELFGESRAKDPMFQVKPNDRCIIMYVYYNGNLYVSNLQDPHFDSFYKTLEQIHNFDFRNPAISGISTHKISGENAKPMTLQDYSDQDFDRICEAIKTLAKRK